MSSARSLTLFVTRSTGRLQEIVMRISVEMRRFMGSSQSSACATLMRSMITYLKVRNLAIVEELEIEPGSGLNVLTGETGAGKSLLIDSLEFLRGARGSTEMIRAGAEKMSAEAVVDDKIVKREIAAGGRGRVSIDGSLFTVRELEAAMEPLLEIHGQSESHNRVAGQTHRELLDQYGGHEALLEQTRTSYRAWRD